MADLGPIPLFFGLLLFALMLACNIYLLVWNRKYKRVAQALPSPGTIERSKPEIVNERREALKSRLLREWLKLPQNELAAARQALWTATLLQAASDGDIDHREMSFVADLFGELSGEKMDFRPVIKAAELVHANKKSALSDISNAKKISNSAKEQILAGAFLVSISDHSLSEVETNCLRQIADALAINRRDRKLMLERITARLGV
jgi:tellurite resistance protein